MHLEKAVDALQRLNDWWENQAFQKREAGNSRVKAPMGGAEGPDLGETEAELLPTPTQTTHYSALWPIYLPSLSFLFIF